MTNQPEPIRKSSLPTTPPPEWEFFTFFPYPDDDGGDMVRGQRQRGVQVRRLVTYGDWEPVRPDRWADEPGSAAVSAAVAPPANQTALSDREKAMLSFALEIAQEEIHARSLDITDQDKAALVSLRRMTDEAQQPGTDRRAEPIHCGLCLYGSDVGVPGYDDKGPAYTNPACPDHNTEATPGVCICGHTEQQHFEDVCQTCGCGDYLEPQDAAEVIARWRQAALKVRAGERAAALREEADRIDANRADFPIAVQNGITWATAEMRRHAAETATETPTPRRGDAFEAWLKAQRDRYDRHGESSEFWHEFDRALDEYRLHADTGTPLGEHVCEAKTVGDCECLEQPAAGARQDGTQP